MSENLFLLSGNKSTIISKNLINDQENPLGLKNGIISLIFLLSAIFSMIFLFVVILIHSKYSKFRKGIYSIIFACIIIEYMYSLILFIHGLDYLTFKSLQNNDTLCDVISFVSVYFVTNLISFNSLLVISLLFDKVPVKVERKKKSINGSIYKDTIPDVKNSKFNFIALHIISHLFSIGLSVYSYIMDYLGRNKTGICLINSNSDKDKYIYIIICAIYFVLSLSYFFKSICMKKRYLESFPMLKCYWIYLIFTSFGWIGCSGIGNSDADILNCVLVMSGIMVFLVIAFYRFQCGYIKNILKQESSNRFIAMIMIMFCLDNKADPNSYERRSTLILRSKTDERYQIN
jgi:hypothetical protein